MFNSAILEVATGIVFVYLLLSLMCTALREGLEGLLRTRASYLESGIRELLHDPGGDQLVKAFYEHPFIFSLFPGDYDPRRKTSAAGAFTPGRALPAYIPATNFAAALMDIVARGPSPTPDPRAAAMGAPARVPDSTPAPASLVAAPHPGADSIAPVTIADLRNHIAALGNVRVQRAVLAALDNAQGDLEKARKNLEHWYDSAMDRVSGRYKRSTQGVVFLIGILVAAVFNVDTISLADYLYRNETQRGAIVAQAGLAIHDPVFLNENYLKVRQQIDDLKLPIGWEFQAQQDARNDAASPSDGASATGLEGVWLKHQVWITKPLGWLLTAFAVTLGAPFWFDILNRIMVIRSTVKPREKSPEEASEDRQTGLSNPILAATAPAATETIPIAGFSSFARTYANRDGIDTAAGNPASGKLESAGRNGTA